MRRREFIVLVGGGETCEMTSVKPIPSTRVGHCLLKLRRV